LRDPNIRRLLLEMRRGNGLPRRLKRSNKESTTGVPQLRWRVLTPVRDV